MRVQVLETIGRKSDYSVIEKLREQVINKFDLEYTNNLVQKAKKGLELHVEMQL